MISQTDSTTNEHAIETMNNTTNVSQQMANNVMLTKPVEMIQPVQCEVCNITCNSKELLAKHKFGKKHTKNLQKIGDSSSSVAPSPPVASAITVGELENKKHRLLQNGASADMLLYCQICNVVCNNQEVLQKHVAGKKHSAKQAITNVTLNSTPECSSQAQIQAQVFNGGSQKNPHHYLTLVRCELCKISCTSNELLNLHLLGKKHLRKLKNSEPIPDLSLEIPESGEGKTVISQEDNLVRCDLCGITCNTYDVLKTHLSGKKHLKNLEKLAQPPIGPNSEPKATVEMIGPMLQDSPKEEGKIVNLDGGKKKGKRGPSDDDVETKKQKILQTGGDLDSIMTCTLCNVVCNSASVYFWHLAGQKHIAMAMKQAEAQGQPTGQTT